MNDSPRQDPAYSLSRSQLQARVGALGLSLGENPFRIHLSVLSRLFGPKMLGYHPTNTLYVSPSGENYSVYLPNVTHLPDNTSFNGPESQARQLAQGFQAWADVAWVIGYSGFEPRPVHQFIELGRRE